MELQSYKISAQVRFEVYQLFGSVSKMFESNKKTCLTVINIQVHLCFFFFLCAVVSLLPVLVGQMAPV